MGKQFMSHHRLIISTLSPVHIGCGEDYEPTHYVMDEGVLYTFDPVAALASDAEARQELLTIVDRSRGETIIQQIQQFFYQRKEQLLPFYLQRMPVGEGVQAFYDARVGKTMQTETKTGNRLEIERLVSVATVGKPILPGSSLKGAIRTALLDDVQDGRPLTNKKDAEGNRPEWKKLAPLPTTLGACLPQAFERDPMRLLRIGDGYPVGEADICSEVFFAVNRKRSGLEGRGPFQTLESLSPMNLESFSADFSSLDPEQARDWDNRKPSDKRGLPPLSLQWNDPHVVRACNQFYKARLQQELAQMRGMIQGDWLRTVQDSLEGGNLQRLLAGGHAMLLRVGRHSGAESVTLNGVRHIKIMRGRGESTWQSHPTTVWMAACDVKQEQNLLPFGWLLVEWAHDQRRPLSESVPELVELSKQFQLDRSNRLRMSDKKLADLRGKEAKRQQDTERLKAEQIRLAVEQAAEQARLATLSPQQQQIEAFLQAVEQTVIPQPISGSLWGKANALVKQANQEGWSQEEKQALLAVCRQRLPGKLKGVDGKKQQALIAPLLV